MGTDRDFDVIVIGAGAGGLTAAAYLAMAGRHVLVVEAQDLAGGHMSAFAHDGREFDIGLHYASTAEAQQVLRPVGVRVDFQDYDPSGMFRVLGPGREIAVPRGAEAFRDRLHQAFPSERQAADAFLDTARVLAEELAQLPERPHLRELAPLPWRMRGLLRHGTATVGGYLDALHASPALKEALLGWSHGSLAVAPSRVWLPAAASLIWQYLQGLGYPQGGSRMISEGLAGVVRRHGGEVLVRTEASRILADGGRVRGVRVTSASPDAAPAPGRDILAPTVVSAVDVAQTYLRLLPEDAAPPRLARRVRGYERAAPFAVAYLILNRDLAAEGYPNATRVASGGADLDEVYARVRAGDLPADGVAAVWIASLADPGNPRLSAPGQTNVQVISLAPADHAWWGIAPGSGPTARYQARKREVRDHLMRLAERAVDGIGDSVVFEETGTPITDERLMRSPEGTSYGPAFTPRQALRRLGPEGAVPGLFHAGASVRPSHGLVGVLQSGLAAAAAAAAIPVAELQAMLAANAPEPAALSSAAAESTARR